DSSNQLEPPRNGFAGVAGEILLVLDPDGTLHRLGGAVVSALNPLPPGTHVTISGSPTNGAVSAIVGGDGTTLIGHDGSSLHVDAGHFYGNAIGFANQIAALINQDGSSLINQDGSS